jgi:hypothetical protein
LYPLTMDCLPSHFSSLSFPICLGNLDIHSTVKNLYKSSIFGDRTCFNSVQFSWATSSHFEYLWWSELCALLNQCCEGLEFFHGHSCVSVNFRNWSLFSFSCPPPVWFWQRGWLGKERKDLVYYGIILLFCGTLSLFFAIAFFRIFGELFLVS